MVVRQVSNMINSCTRSFGSSDIKSWLGRSITLLGEGIAKNRLAACGAGTFAVLCVIAVIYRRSNQEPFSFYHTENLQPLGMSKSLLTILLSREDVRTRPVFHLHALCNEIQQRLAQRQNCHMAVHYMKGRPSNFHSTATGDYLYVLTESLVSKLQSCFSKQPQGVIPSAENLSAPLAQVFKNLGYLIMYCYTSDSPNPPFFINRSMGRHFDEGLFVAALSLSAQEIDNVSGQLAFETRMKIYHAFVYTREPIAWDPLRDLRNILSNIENSGPPSDYSELINRLTPHGTPPVLPSTHDAQKEHLEILICSTVQAATGIDPKKIIEPILMIAKGMKEFYLLWSENESSNDAWNSFVSRMHRSSFTNKVQGYCITLEFRKHLVGADGCVGVRGSQPFMENVYALQQWIVDPQTSDEHIRLFLRFVTGTDIFVPGQYWHIKSAEGQDVIPRADTSTCALIFPEQLPEDFAALPEKEREEQFMRLFVQEIERVGRLPDSK